MRCNIITLRLRLSSELTFSTTVQLKWIQEPRDVETSVGKSLHVVCSASGQPAPQIQWTRVDAKNQFIGPELSFNSIAVEDAGEYECRAKNGVEEDLVRRIRVNVLGKY